MTIEHRAYRDRYGDAPAQGIVYDREHFNREARLAFAFLERWGMVQAREGEKEDSAGRATLKLMPVDDVVARAFEMAEKAFEEARKRGLTMELPSFDELEDEVKERENRRENV